MGVTKGFSPPLGVPKRGEKINPFVTHETKKKKKMRAAVSSSVQEERESQKSPKATHLSKLFSHLGWSLSRAPSQIGAPLHRERASPRSRCYARVIWLLASELDTKSRIPETFFCTLSLSSFWTSRGHRRHPFSSPILAFSFYRA